MTFLVLLASLLMALGAAADTIYLNSGVEVSGAVTEIEPGIFQLKVGERTVLYRADEIREVEKNDKTGVRSREEILAEAQQIEAELLAETGLNGEQRAQIDALVQSLIQDDASVRGSAMDKLIALQQQFDVFRYLAWYLPRHNQAFAWAVIEALYQIDGRRALSIFREYTQNPHYAARAAALEALGLLGDRESQPLIVRGLVDHKPEVQYSAAIALARLGVKDATPALIQLLERSDPRVASAAQSALVALWSGSTGENPPATPGDWVNLLQGELPKLARPVELEGLTPLIEAEHEFFFG